jgi:hypothetical protein
MGGLNGLNPDLSSLDDIFEGNAKIAFFRSCLTPALSCAIDNTVFI